MGLFKNCILENFVKIFVYLIIVYFLSIVVEVFFWKVVFIREFWYILCIKFLWLWLWLEREDKIVSFIFNLSKFFFKFNFMKNLFFNFVLIS